MADVPKEDHSALSDVPQRVFATFLESLLGKGVPPDVIARLRKTLLLDRKCSDKAIKDAIFPEIFNL